MLSNPHPSAPAVARAAVLEDIRHYECWRGLRAKISEINHRSSSAYEASWLLDDKVAAKRVFAQLGARVPRTLAFVEEGGDVDAFISHVGNFDEFVLKPNHLAMGTGVLILRRVGGDRFVDPAGVKYGMLQLTSHVEYLLDKPTKGAARVGVLLEERIRPEPGLNASNPFADTIVDLRLYLVYQTIPFGKLRVPTVKSRGLGNTSQGAVGFHVDDDGVIGVTTHMHRCAERHPDTGTRMVGERMPRWDEIREIAARISMHFEVPFHSVDLTIDDRGRPCVIECTRLPELCTFTWSGAQYLVEYINQVERRIRGPLPCPKKHNHSQ